MLRDTYAVEMLLAGVPLGKSQPPPYPRIGARHRKILCSVGQITPTAARGRIHRRNAENGCQNIGADG
jgi:hypothetical protein